MKKKTLFILFFIIVSFSAFSQMAYRMKADILTKTRLVDSTFQVSKGKLFYDKNYRKIIFDFSFPQKEKIVLFDTLMYNFREDTLFSLNKNLLIPDQSLFSFILAGKMSNYGLEDTKFTIKGFEKKEDMVITTWLPPDPLKKFFSKVLIATKNKLLYSITVVNKEGKVINRQILKKYITQQGIDVPSEILIATYPEKGGSIYQVINMENIVINEQKNNNLYDKDL